MNSKANHKIQEFKIISHLESSPVHSGLSTFLFLLILQRPSQFLYQDHTPRYNNSSGPISSLAQQRRHFLTPSLLRAISILQPIGTHRPSPPLAAPSFKSLSSLEISSLLQAEPIIEVRDRYERALNLKNLKIFARKLAIFRNNVYLCSVRTYVLTIRVEFRVE